MCSLCCSSNICLLGFFLAPSLFLLHLLLSEVEMVMLCFHILASCYTTVFSDYRVISGGKLTLIRGGES